MIYIPKIAWQAIDVKWCEGVNNVCLINSKYFSSLFSLGTQSPLFEGSITIYVQLKCIKSMTILYYYILNRLDNQIWSFGKMSSNKEEKILQLLLSHGTRKEISFRSQFYQIKKVILSNLKQKRRMEHTNYSSLVKLNGIKNWKHWILHLPRENTDYQSMATPPKKIFFSQ